MRWGESVYQVRLFNRVIQLAFSVFSPFAVAMHQATSRMSGGSLHASDSVFDGSGINFPPASVHTDEGSMAGSANSFPGAQFSVFPQVSVHIQVAIQRN